jgi:ketosteroid isomerase-like protein
LTQELPGSRSRDEQERSRRLIQTMFDSIDRRQWDRLPDFFTDDVLYERPGYPPIVGIDQLARFYRDVRIVASGRHELLQIMVDGSTAACAGRFVGRDRSGQALDERFADVYTLRQGKVATRISHFYRPAI